MSGLERGRFITVEGGEGVGKTLLMSTLREWLASLGFDSLLTYEPGGTPSAARIRKIFLDDDEGDPLLPLTEAFLVSAARAQHVGRLVRPALEKGTWVLSDRFADSTRVYQGIMAGVSEDVLEPLIKTSVEGMEPDLTLLLDCPVDVSAKRLSGRGKENRFDAAGLEYHEKLRQTYLQIAKKFPERMLVIDASASPREVGERAIAGINERWSVES